MRWGIFLVILGLFSCHQEPQLSGEKLAQTQCISCHAFPDPHLLDRNTWERYVLPRMGYMYGIYPDDSTRRSLIEAGVGGERVEKRAIFPSQPTLDPKSWEAIQAYFLNEAPEALTLPLNSSPQYPLPGFEVRIPPLRMSPPSSTLVNLPSPGRVLLGDAHTKSFYELNQNLELVRAGKVEEGAVDWIETPEALKLTVMGSFSPTDNPSGFVLELPYGPGKKPRKVVPNLQRPVDMAIADLDEDGKEDLVICEYAKWTGKLAWWKQQDDGNYYPQVLRNKPGAIQVDIRDWNDDGKEDILALMGQGDEGIFLYLNQGQGTFEENRLLQFPPAYGSSGFELVDWNRDGKMDILYTAGDNADYPPLLKPFHGIRLFLNQGNMTFEERFFLPYHGAYGTVCRDFDGDGDWDIAAISFFPDFDRDPRGGFRYFQNQGDDSFRSFGTELAEKGRWLVMNGGDWEGDGDEDLILGSLAFEVLSPGTFVEDWVAEGIPFIILENKRVP